MAMTNNKVNNNLSSSNNSKILIIYNAINQEISKLNKKIGLQ